MSPSRRRWLASLAAGVAALSLPPGVRAAAAGKVHGDTAFTRPLPLPAELRGKALADGTLEYRLQMQQGRSELVAGVHTPSWGYNGAYLGPALRVPRGKPVSIRVRNALSQPSTTHWHGAHVPGAVDGGPQRMIAVGKEQVSAFTLDQPAATLWFHPHPDGLTGAHVWAGLAGLLLVDDGIDARLGLPCTWGVDDIPLVLQDRRIAPSGKLVYMPSTADLMGMKGDRFLVNGRERPFVELPAQKVRLRLLNGSNARVYNLKFSDTRPFHVIASDSGLLARPVELKSLLLSPGERAEIVVDLADIQGKTLLLRSDSGAVVPDLSIMPSDSDAFDHSGFDLLQIRVVAPNARAAQLPARLVDVPALRADADAPVRTFSLQTTMPGGGGMAGMSGMSGMDNNMSGGMAMGGSAPSMPDQPLHGPATGPGGMSVGVGMQNLFGINHQFMDMKVINQRVRLGATETWEIANGGEMGHPFHVHGTSFQIVSRDGLPPDEHERGWKDVVFLRRDETVRVVARFGQPAGDARPYMYHCHILEHEDNGMMGQFTVA